MDNKHINSLTHEQAELIREACVKAAKEGYLDASIRGLCFDGAMEASLSAIQMLDLEKLLSRKS
ncbi:MAG: acetyltransferase [Balneolaceae bacterium]